MQNTTRTMKTVRTALVTGSLLAALVFGSVTASGNAVGLTECDHGCGIAILSGQAEPVARFQDVIVPELDISAYVSNGPGEIGYTR